MMIVEKFKNKEEFKCLKLCFHAVLGKVQEEVWWLMKIIQLLRITNDVLFENFLQNFRYQVGNADNVVTDFSVADFPLMNLNGLIQVARILKGVDHMKLQGTSKEGFVLGHAHVKLFIDNYYDCLALSDIEMELAIRRKVTVSQSIQKNSLS